MGAHLINRICLYKVVKVKVFTMRVFFLLVAFFTLLRGQALMGEESDTRSWTPTSAGCAPVVLKAALAAALRDRNTPPEVVPLLEALQRTPIADTHPTEAAWAIQLIREHLPFERTLAPMREAIQNSALPSLSQLRVKLGPSLLEQMTAARNREDWQKMIDLFESSGTEEKNLDMVRLLYAFALNRRYILKGRQEERDLQGSRKVSLEVILGVSSSRMSASDKKGVLSEAYSILARTYKDDWSYYKNRDNEEATAALDRAIDLYLKGFMADDERFYPGIAALELIWLKSDSGDLESQARENELLPLVMHAVLREIARGNTEDYWVMSTEIQLLVRQGNWAEVRDRVSDLLTKEQDLMKLQGSLDGYHRMLDSLPEARREAQPHLQWMVAQYESALDRAKDKMNSSALHKSFKSPIALPVILSRAPLKEELARTGVAGELIEISAHSKGGTDLANSAEVISIYRMLADRQKGDPRGGYLLAKTGPFKKVMEKLAEVTHLQPWWEAYLANGISLRADHTEEFLQRIWTQTQPIYFLVPPDFNKDESDSPTRREFSWIKERLKSKDSNQKAEVFFVLGAYDLVDLEFYTALSERQANQEFSSRHLEFLLLSLQGYLAERSFHIRW